MGKITLTHSPIHLEMENQFFFFPISKLANVEVDLAGVNNFVDFEVIDILDEKDNVP
jgi:hypothetical protein